ncbi:MAG: ribonuclease catalytic domain-containing protein [Pseudobdellovibrionaceae bacterium]
MGQPKAKHDIYTVSQIADWLALSPRPLNFSKIARALELTGKSAQNDLSGALDDAIKKGRVRAEDKNGERLYSSTQPVSQLILVRIIEGENGHRYARALNWDGKENEDLPLVRLKKTNKIGKSLKTGDRILVTVKSVDKYGMIAMPRKNFGAEGPIDVQGQFTAASGTPSINVTFPGLATQYALAAKTRSSPILVKEGDRVQARFDLEADQRTPAASVTQLLWHESSQIGRLTDLAMRENALPENVENRFIKLLKKRDNSPYNREEIEELRNVTMLVIDPNNAQDHDDCVGIKPDPDPANPNGHIIYVGIADVAHYVRPNDELDERGRQFGYSTYFPDRAFHLYGKDSVEKFCSFREGQQARALVIKMKVTEDGDIIDEAILRGMITPTKNLTYDTADSILSAPFSYKDPNVRIALMNMAAIAASRTRSSAEEIDGLDLNEAKITPRTDERGVLTGFDQIHKTEARHIIEKMMVMANAAAFRLLDDKGINILSRQHPAPDIMEVEDALRKIRRLCGDELYVPKAEEFSAGSVTSILSRIRDPHKRLLAERILMQPVKRAVLGLGNPGHWGLGESGYTRFTSPIRRYEDLIVHRALIQAYHLGIGGMIYGNTEQMSLAQHLNNREIWSKSVEDKSLRRLEKGYFHGLIGKVVPAEIINIHKDMVELRIGSSPFGHTFPVDALIPQTQSKTDLRSRFLNLRPGQSIPLEIVSSDPVSEQFKVRLGTNSKRKSIPAAPARPTKTYMETRARDMRSYAKAEATLESVCTKYAVLRFDDGSSRTVPTSTFMHGSIKSGREPGQIYSYVHKTVLEPGMRLKIRYPKDGEIATASLYYHGPARAHEAQIEDIKVKTRHGFQKSTDGSPFAMLEQLKVA